MSDATATEILRDFDKHAEASDLELIETLRAHEDFQEWLVGLQDAVRRGGELSHMLIKLLKGGSDV